MVTVWLATSAPLDVIKTLMRQASGAPDAVVVFAVLVRRSAL